MQWCVQEAGEILVLPPFHHHATLNLGDTIGVAGQSNAFKWTDPVHAATVLSERATQDPGNPRLHEALANALEGASGTTDATLQSLLRAAEAEPLNHRLLLKSARVAIDLGRRPLVRPWHLVTLAARLTRPRGFPPFGCVYGCGWCLHLSTLSSHTSSSNNTTTAPLHADTDRAYLCFGGGCGFLGGGVRRGRGGCFLCLNVVRPLGCSSRRHLRSRRSRPQMPPTRTIWCGWGDR